MSPVQVKTPAKINLTLAVRGRRADGFHEIESLAIPIAIYDTLQITRSSGIYLEVRGSFSAPADETNLVHRAALALAAAAGCEPDAHIILTKNIPVGAGLGGGSSDAAAALLALSRFWELDWPQQRLASIAEELGSDVPFFLYPRPAMMRGRGERIEPATWTASDLDSMWIALIVPTFSLSTADVYRRHAEIAAPVKLREPFDPGNATRNARALMDLLFNDLELAAFACEPRLVELHSKLSARSDRPIRMSGSGSSLYSLFDSEGEANSWAAGLMDICKSTCDIRIVRLHTPA